MWDLLLSQEPGGQWPSLGDRPSALVWGGSGAFSSRQAFRTGLGRTWAPGFW